MLIEEQYKVVIKALMLACEDLQKSANNLEDKDVNSRCGSYLIKAEEELGFGLSFEE